ncbi:MAG: radical SAM protein [Planctomycetota bacterium]
MTSPASPAPPELPPGPLDALWIQLGGTLCNLECTHCFISCSPKNRSLDLMTLDEVEPILAEAERLGVREYYFTGGEVFIVKELEAIVERTLARGPATLLTNGTLITAERAERLAAIADASPYSLEFRVSLDGFTPEENDAIRGRGTFERAMRGVENLVKVGFLPIITATEVWEPGRGGEVLAGFMEELRRRGCTKPRLKILPRLKMGAEAERTEGYASYERITPELWDGYDASLLVCHSSRTVSGRGVHICPILVDDPVGLLGDDLEKSTERPYPLVHSACYTCWQYGSICANVSSGPTDGGY